MTQTRPRFWVALAIAAIMVISSSIVIATANAPSVTQPPITVTPTPSPSSQSSGSALSPATGQLGINSGLASAVAAKEQAILSSGGSLANFHPPNLHQAPPLSSTHGLVTPLYSVAPAPMGVAYYGESDTDGTLQGTTVNTTSLAGSWSTADPIATAAELFDTSSGNAAGEFGAQLNTVLVNVTVGGQTSFGPNANAPGAGCSATTGTVSCPNEFWLQNYIEYTESTHALQIGDEIWNFSNPNASWSGSASTGTHTLTGFGSVSGGLYGLSGSGYAFTVTVAPPFSLVLYINYTQGPCHTDSPAGTGVPSCGSVSTTEPVNELFMNYTIIKNGARVCPTTEPTGRVCGEYDDVFFNSVGTSNPSGVPVYGPCTGPSFTPGNVNCNPRLGSATIQANGTAYDPVGLTNDYEMDYGIGSDDGATNNIVYQDGTVGINYCQNDNVTVKGSDLSCSSFSATPAAEDFGGETGETSTGEVGYWTANGPLNPGVPGPSAPVVHLVTGPSLLLGLWNMTGAPYPSGAGGEPLSYANIAPANAWVGIAAGAGQTDQALFQVAPTFGWYSYWKGSGGATSPTTLGSDLYLPVGEYTIEVLLSGYTPYIGNVNLLTSGQAPSITLVRNPSEGVYTPIWAFSSADLSNISVNGGSFGAGQSGNPYQLISGAPTVGSPFGESGSLSWLFSNLNDYLFTVWIGEFINSTTSYAESNPVPTFTMEYPSWQQSVLTQFDVPSTDQFQVYLDNVQNFTVAGGTHIYAWANSEATTLYSVICNTCHNDLFADNSFAVSNRGMEFINGGTTLTTGNALAETRNVVWGNTFTPDPQPSYTGLDAPGTGLVLSEAFDRVWNNAFYTNQTATASSADQDLWNVTCQVGYAPLSQATYPGTVTCQPASYVTTYLGFQLTGSIIGTAYQGGNFWSNYGNNPNPYANLPYVDRASSTTGSAGIGSTVVGFHGDYAPLIGYTVYDPNFAETGIASSTTATAFEVHVSNATYTWFNDTQTTTPTGTCSSNPCVDFYLPAGTYTYDEYSSLAYAANPATGSFTITNAPIGLEATLSFLGSQTVTFTESGLASGTHWSVSIPGQPTTTSTTTTVVFHLPNGGYTYTVGAVAGYATSAGSGSFSVSGAAVPISVPFYAVLTPPATPTVSATALDVDQALTVSGTIPTTGVPTYSWQWEVSVNSGLLGAATQCATNSGTGASAGAAVACVIAGNSLTPGDTYAFALQVTDSAGTPEVQTSGNSATVSVATALVAPSTPSVSATDLDADQGFSVSTTLTSTGTATYSWAWQVSVGGTSYVAATECTASSGSGASGGATETCSVTGGTFTAGDTYAFELVVTDSASHAETATSGPSSTVTVSGPLGAPGAPTVSATALDADQVLTVTGTLGSSGTAPYSWGWLVSVNGGSYTAATVCTTNSGTGASGGATETCTVTGGTLSAGSTYAFELTVTDSASNAEMQTSAPSSTVTVGSALTAPATPGVSATALDVDQALTVSGTIPSSGTGPYAWTWLVAVNSGSYGATTQCGTNGGTGASAGTPVNCVIAANTLTVGDAYTFELSVTDSASAAETQTSGASSPVAVASALTTPAKPTVSATVLDADQTLTVSGHVPFTGTAPVSWTWMVSIDGGTFVAASQCATNSGSGSGPVACVVSGGTLSAGHSYRFELSVTDSASVAETQTSVASSSVSVNSALSAPTTPSVSATALDVDQSLTVSGTIPTTGTAPYAWTWLVSIGGGTYAAATQCGTNGGSGASGGASETCVVSANGLSAGSTYAFELSVTDSASAAETQASGASSTVSVASALTAPGTPTANRPLLDVNQALTVSGAIPTTGTAPYSWTWLVAVNGGSPVAATQCGTNSGTGAAAGASEPCVVAASTLTVGDTYAFALQVTDSATSTQTQTSSASATISVASALKAPSAPTDSGTALDLNQALTVTAKLPTTGTAPYQWTWVVSVSGGSYATASQCAAPSGTGGTSGQTVTCSIASGTLTVGDTYAFKLAVSDGASTTESATTSASSTVHVKSTLVAPAAPSLSTSHLVVSQTLTVKGKIPSSGTSKYAWTWYVSVNGGAYTAATQCSTNSGTGAGAGVTETCTIAGGTLTVGNTYAFELHVTDSATAPETVVSAASKTVSVVA